MTSRQRESTGMDPDASKHYKFRNKEIIQFPPEINIKLLISVPYSNSPCSHQPSGTYLSKEAKPPNILPVSSLHIERRLHSRFPFHWVSKVATWRRRNPILHPLPTIWSIFLKWPRIFQLPPMNFVEYLYVDRTFFLSHNSASSDYVPSTPTQHSAPRPCSPCHHLIQP